LQLRCHGRELAATVTIANTNDPFISTHFTAVGLGAIFVAGQERVAPRAFSKFTREVGSDRAGPGKVSRLTHKDKIDVPG